MQSTGEAILKEYPDLQSFVLPNVRATGVRIGAGAYGSVEEVAVPGAICAAKKIHDILIDRSEIPPAEIRRATAQFVKECQLMSTLQHPNIVQFLGVAFLPGSRLPALVMERLLTSLHDLLDPDIDPPLPPDAPKPSSFPLGLKNSILHNIASGLAYLHEQSPPVIHRDLSARNILLNSKMVAKIVDLGVARIIPARNKAAATMTKGPGASVYMPPEASAPAKSNKEKSKYDVAVGVEELEKRLDIVAQENAELTKALKEKEAELERAEETIRQQENQIQRIKHRYYARPETTVKPVWVTPPVPPKYNSSSPIPPPSSPQRTHSPQEVTEDAPPLPPRDYKDWSEVDTSSHHYQTIDENQTKTTEFEQPHQQGYRRDRHCYDKLEKAKKTTIPTSFTKSHPDENEDDPVFESVENVGRATGESRRYNYDPPPYPPYPAPRDEWAKPKRKGWVGKLNNPSYFNPSYM